MSGPAPLPLDPAPRYGVMSASFTRAELRETVARLEDLAFDSLWAGDHVAFTSPIPDPLLQLAQAAALSDRLAVGTSVYLLPLRPPAAAAKQAATLDALSDGRFTFGLGVGGEFPGEFDACGVDVHERGARLSEGIDVMRALWSGETVSHRGRFWRFEDVRMQPAPLTPGGPALWCGGRSAPALRRIGRKADGWISYVVTPEQYREGLATIGAAAASAGREITRFGTAHLVFVRIDERRDRALEAAAAILGRRYAMDFRRAAERYCALGSPREIAASLGAFHRAGVRTLILDPLGSPPERRAQLERFAREVRPLLAEAFPEPSR